MIGVIGAGAFGTALAVALGQDGRKVMLWARDPVHAAEIAQTRINQSRLPGIKLPLSVTVSAKIDEILSSDAVLLALPMQGMRDFLHEYAAILDGSALVACCKGVDLVTLRGPCKLIEEICPKAVPAILTGPSFAADIARGLPTALTLACADQTQGAALQAMLSTPVLRLYRTADVTGAELGGAMKNVIAIAAGVAIGAGLGESARAALMTRGYGEMVRAAQAMGARAETLAGLSGLGDLVLTCTSDQSRNFRFGRALGQGVAFDPKITVEGVATAHAMIKLAESHRLDLPITAMVAALTMGEIALPQAIQSLLNRPLKQE